MDGAAPVWLADAILGLHVVFVGFVVAGQALILMGWWVGWHWTRNWVLRVVHLCAIGVVVLEAWCGIACPLTVWENSLRRGGGDAGYDLSFVGYWMQRLLYYNAPNWVFLVAYSAFAALVVLTFAFYPPRRRR